MPKEDKKIKAVPKKDLKEIISSCKSKIFRINLNTWHFSVSFFVAIFCVSLWIWWVGFYMPEPSQEVVTKFESSKENFESMKASTETAIELLKDRQEKVKNTPDFSGQRDLFVDKKKLELLEAEENKNGNANEGDLLQKAAENADSVQ